MRRIVIVALSTITTLVLLFSYHTSTGGGTLAGAQPVQTPGQGGSRSAAPGPSTAAPSTPSPTASGSSSSAATSARYTGDVADTRWGPVQVQITVRVRKIIDAQAVQYPNGNGRDQEINSYALPVLSQEVVQRQSAQIDTVSGATVTSDGYLQSLQSAIDRAHL